MFTVASCDSWQIICKTFDEVDSRGEFVGCGARILQFFPIRYPKGTWVKGKFKTTTDNLAIWAYNKLVPKWNRRAKPE